MRPLDDPDSSLPFIREILSTLRHNVGNASTVLGFIGAPWTLAAYAMEGQADRCTFTHVCRRRCLCMCHKHVSVVSAHDVAESSRHRHKGTGQSQHFMDLCRHCLHTKRIMMNNPEILRELLERLTDALVVYVCHQIDSGAQVGAVSYYARAVLLP